MKRGIRDFPDALHFIQSGRVVLLSLGQSQRGQVSLLSGIKAHGFDVHAGDGHQVGAVVGVEVVLIGLMREEVRESVSVVHSRVGGHPASCRPA